MIRYLAMDIGCIECGEPSAVIGIFDDEAEAKAALVEPAKEQADNWHGQHSFEVFEVQA